MRSSVILSGVFVMPGEVLPTYKSNQPAKWWWTGAIVVLAVVLLLIFISAATRNKPVEETVTLSQHVEQRPTAGTPVATVAPLPTADRDLELIGDRVAEAAVYLRQHQRNPALHALAAAENTTRHLRDTRPDLDSNVLSATETELAAIEREVQRGNTDEARQRLLKLGRDLDLANNSQ